jgi:hypothetical protein
MQLVDANKDGTFSSGEKMTIGVKLRNFGGKAASEGQISVRVKTISGGSVEAKLSVLKELPTDTEASFLKVLNGTIGGSHKLKVVLQVLDEGEVIGEVSAEEAILSNYKLMKINNDNKMRASWTNGWFSQTLQIKNEGTKTTPSARIKVTSRDPRVKVYQDWINIPSLSPNYYTTVKFWIMLDSLGGYEDHVLDLHIKDYSERTLFNKGFVIPIN